LDVLAKNPELADNCNVTTCDFVYRSFEFIVIEPLGAPVLIDTVPIGE
jgi:hypothetical protein